MQHPGVSAPCRAAGRWTVISTSSAAVPVAFKIYSDTWRSPDGINWEQMSAKSGWGKRCYPEVDVVQGHLILNGGQSLTTFYNDVWRSADQGRTWEQVCADAPWGVRAGHHSHVMDDEIYMFGGARNSFDRIFYPELWVSKDLGETWELRCELPEDMGRAGMQVCHIDGTMYYMGGDHDKPVFQANWEGRRNDVWKSEDKGATWELLGHAPWDPAHRTSGRRAQRQGHRDRRPRPGTEKRFEDPVSRTRHVGLGSEEGMDGWQKVTDNVWGCEDQPGPRRQERLPDRGPRRQDLDVRWRPGAVFAVADGQ